MFTWFFRASFDKVLNICSRLVNNRYRLFLLWLRTISIITLVLQIQTLISIGTYALALHQRRKVLADELHTVGILFVSTVRRCQNQPKILFSQERRFDKTIKRRLNNQQRSRTI